jgi:hypothetical protein
MELELVFVVSWKPQLYLFIVIVCPFLFVVISFLFLRDTN